MKKNIFKTKYAILLIIFFALDAALIAYWHTVNSQPAAIINQFALPPADGNFPEIADLQNKQNVSFEELQSYFQNVAKNKGARYAFNLLKVAPLAPNTDLHLLGHAVGDILYKQEGLNGITACTNDFRNACSHAIVIGLFFDKGDGALADIADACRKAPGGNGAYTMCFHGLGHGILAYEGYDMQKTAAMCQKTGTAQFGFREGTECIGGSVMEIIEGGGHDHETWAKQRLIYLDPKHPLSLCQSDFIPQSSRFMCYEYLTPYLFEAAGGDFNSPNPAIFPKAFAFCNAVPLADTADRNSCFGGFGKEFDGIVQSKDIRLTSINNISDDRLKQVYNWCAMAQNKAGTTVCMNDALNSLYWGGENDPNVSVRYCNQVSDSGDRHACFVNLVGNVSSYTPDTQKRKNICAQFPVEEADMCKKILLQ
jgi:hypothetical protein